MVIPVLMDVLGACQSPHCAGVEVLERVPDFEEEPVVLAVLPRTLLDEELDTPVVEDAPDVVIPELADELLMLDPLELETEPVVVEADVVPEVRTAVDDPTVPEPVVLLRVESRGVDEEPTIPLVEADVVPMSINFVVDEEPTISLVDPRTDELVVPTIADVVVRTRPVVLVLPPTLSTTVEEVPPVIGAVVAGVVVTIAVV